MRVVTGIMLIILLAQFLTPVPALGQGSGPLRVSIDLFSPGINLKVGDKIKVIITVTNMGFYDLTNVNVWLETSKGLEVVKPPPSIPVLRPGSHMCEATLKITKSGQQTVKAYASYKSVLTMIAQSNTLVINAAPPPERYPPDVSMFVSMEGEPAVNETVKFVIKLKNHGMGFAHNVNITMLVNNETVAQQIIDSITPGREAIAVLTYTFLREGRYNVLIVAKVPGDKNSGDNTWRGTIRVTKYGGEIEEFKFISMSFRPGKILPNVNVSECSLKITLSGPKEEDTYILEINLTSDIISHHGFYNITLAGTRSFDIPLNCSLNLSSGTYEIDIRGALLPSIGDVPILEFNGTAEVVVEKIIPPLVSLPEWIPKGVDVTANFTNNASYPVDVKLLAIRIGNKSLDNIAFSVLEWEPGRSYSIKLPLGSITKDLNESNYTIQFVWKIGREGERRTRMTTEVPIKILKKYSVVITHNQTVTLEGNEGVIKGRVLVSGGWHLKNLTVSSDPCDVTYMRLQGNELILRLRGEGKCTLRYKPVVEKWGIVEEAKDIVMTVKLVKPEFSVDLLGVGIGVAVLAVVGAAAFLLLRRRGGKKVPAYEELFG